MVSKYLHTDALLACAAVASLCLVLLGGALAVTAVWGITIATEENAGGVVVCFLLAIITLTIGGHLALSTISLGRPND